MKEKFPLYFLVLGLFALIVGAMAGTIISIVYIDPTFFKGILPFNQLRPIHTTSVASWIVLTAIGGVYFYLRNEGLKIRFPVLGKIHFILFLLTGIGIYFSFLSKNMGGREYLEFLPILTVPILLGWLLFGINYFSSMLGKVRDWPVYYWMWGIGIIFMIFHLSESHFWLFKSIRSDYIKDLSIQWKSYGSFVGSWNLLVYGTSIYLMAKVKSDSGVGRGKKSFFFFFLGLTNLMFGWAHHTYIIPTQPWIRYVAYVISMTEWIIFINIVYTWAKSLTDQEKKKHFLLYKFMIASEIWVFLNLTLALLMSIPTLNYYTHGTHITVAHSMGTTIGINTSILFASLCYIVGKLYNFKGVLEGRTTKFGFVILNVSLLFFWLTLIIGGIYRAIWTTGYQSKSFSALQESSHGIYVVFIFFGVCLLIGILMITISMLNRIFPYCFLAKNDD